MVEATYPVTAAPDLIRLSPDESAHMDIGLFGQQAGMQIYTQITYILAAGDDASRPAIVNTLKTGLERLGEAFPWLAGEVVLNDRQYRFELLGSATAPQLTVKDLAAEHPELTLAALRDAGYPMRLLDEAVVAPRRTLPGDPSEADLTDRPVFLVEAGFVTGGLLLTIVAHHATMDMAGQGEAIRLMSKACRKEVFTEDELLVGNCDRRSVVSLLVAAQGGDNPFQLIPEQIVPDKTDSEKALLDDGENEAPQPAACSWAYVCFSAASLASLKAEATAWLVSSGQSSTAFVSTNDVCTAFLWQLAMRARLPRMPEAASAPAHFARAIDVRSFMGLPAGYPAMMQNMTLHCPGSVQQVADLPIGALALALRSEIVPTRLRLRTQALATCMARFPDEASRKVTFVGGHMDTAAGGLMVSSWVSVPATTPDMDFGLDCGVALAVRRPAFAPVEGLGYLMPRMPGGTMAACICLRDEDWVRIQVDPQFCTYATYIG